MNKVSGTDRASNFVIGNDEQMENFITKQTDETFQLLDQNLLKRTNAFMFIFHAMQMAKRVWKVILNRLLIVIEQINNLKYAALAQLVERDPSKVDVAGSRPVCRSEKNCKTSSLLF